MTYSTDLLRARLAALRYAPLNRAERCQTVSFRAAPPSNQEEALPAFQREVGSGKYLLSQLRSRFLVSVFLLYASSSFSAHLHRHLRSLSSASVSSEDTTTRESMAGSGVRTLVRVASHGGGQDEAGEREERRGAH
jgi:hypothetical protein